MLKVVAIQYNNSAPVLPLHYALPETGGTIGRDNDNAVALPDPLRLLSRRHVLIEPDGSGYRMTNVSSANTATINDAPLAPGDSQALKHGDLVYVGGYLLSVDISEDGNEAATVQAQPAAAALQDAPAATQPNNKPHDNWPARATPAEEINAILERGATEPLMTADPLGLAAVSPTVKLADLDTRSAQLLAGLGQAQRPAANSFDLGLTDLTRDPLADSGQTVLREDVLDPLAIFGGEAQTFADLLGTLDAPHTGVGLASAALGTTPARAVSELHTPFSLAARNSQATEATYQSIESTQSPTQSPNPPPAAARALGEPQPAGQGRAPLIPEEFVLDELLGKRAEVAAPTPETPLASTPSVAATPPESTPPSATPPEPPPSAAAPPAATPSEPTPAPATQLPATQPPHADLHAALLAGLGLAELPQQRPLDADLMRTLGALLRTAVAGTLQLMAARAAVKREVRANVTVIAPERNNPLKFSPDAEVALMYLLGQGYPGFMDGPAAVQNAFADLQAHQVGMVSGMRSALALVLDRFDPEAIARTANTYGTGHRLLAMGRKARLWDAYGRYFAQTRVEAEERFQEFFGAAFMHAYEESVARHDSADGSAA